MMELKLINSSGALITINSFDREETSLYSLQIETRSLNSGQHLYWTIIQVAIMVCSLEICAQKMETICFLKFKKYLWST